ncbi:hypothetical protein KXV85_004276, partial [Aspergillus fumigatus]
GQMWVNQHIAIGPHIPMAGFKNSGLGVEQSVEGLAEYTQLQMTLGEALSVAARRWGSELALVSRHQNICWSWQELNREAERVACGLLDHGVRRGDRVGIWAPNCAEWTVIQFATAKIGAILVNINPAYRVSEIEYALAKVGCSVLVTASAFKS